MELRTAGTDHSTGLCELVALIITRVCVSLLSFQSNSKINTNPLYIQHIFLGKMIIFTVIKLVYILALQQLKQHIAQTHAMINARNSQLHDSATPEELVLL